MYINSDIKRRRVVEGVLINSIPTKIGNKSFNTLDKINARKVISESNLSSFVEDANSHNMSFKLDQNRPNPFEPDPGLTPEQQMGRITIVTIERRSRRNL